MAPMDVGEYLRTQYLYNNKTEKCCPKPGDPEESGAISNDDPNYTSGK